METPWNAVWNVATKKLYEFPVNVGEKSGGRLCAFSASGNEVLTVHNSARSNPQSPKAEAEAHVWRYTDDAWSHADSFPVVGGFPLDCWQSPQGAWLLLVVRASRKSTEFKLEPHITLHNLTAKSTRTFELPTGSFVGATADADRTGFFTLLYLPGSGSQTAYGQLYHALSKDGELELQADFPGSNLPIGTHGTGRDAACDLRVVNSTRWTCNASGKCVVYLDRPRPELEQLAANSVGALDHLGSRFFTCSAERKLEVFNPRSPVPTQRLFQFPGNHFPLAPRGVIIAADGNLLCAYGDLTLCLIRAPNPSVTKPE
jgi:hypothetical protein